MREAGYQVYEAGNGEQAVDLAPSVRPGLVIMDVLMPGISGIEATERLAQSQNSKVVVIGSGKSGLPLILGQ